MTSIGSMGIPGGGAGGIGGIGSIHGSPGAGGNPLGGLADQTGLNGSLSGLGDMGLGSGSADGGMGNGAAAGIAPTNAATSSQGESFGNTLRSMVIENPSAAKAQANTLAARFAAGDTSIDPHQVALASAKAGVEIQMATRTISSAVSSVRTLFQMQI
ncbi:MAG: flagellar hook-basal body complex protein FliE [Thermoleophilia bacterium]|nr:flagellar hook-basal body complex protein FliE [Thermoleophilia bacterium]